MNKPTCPYMVSGVCHRNGCIYLPNFDCLKEDEFRHRMKIAKKMSREIKKSAKRGKISKYAKYEIKY